VIERVNQIIDDNIRKFSRLPCEIAVSYKEMREILGASYVMETLLEKGLIRPIYRGVRIRLNGDPPFSSFPASKQGDNS
jgi:hypothetical protein